MIALTSSSAPPTAIPTKRNGSRSSQTNGYAISASSASGQHSTRRIHHNKNFTITSAPLRSRSTTPTDTRIRERQFRQSHWLGIGRASARGKPLGSSSFLLALAAGLTLCQHLLSIPDRLLAFPVRHGQDGFRPLGQSLKDKRMGSAQFVFDLPWPERVPALHRHPACSGQIGRCDDSLIFEHFVKPFGTTVEPQDPGSGAIQVRHGKHFAADIPVAHPINKMMAPVHRLRHMRQRHADLADALVVHAIQSKSQSQGGALAQNLISKSRNRRSSSHWAAAFSLLSRKLLQPAEVFAPPRSCPLHAAAGAVNASCAAHRLSPGRKLCSMPVRANCFRSCSSSGSRL